MMISKFALILLIFNNTMYTYPIYIKLACMIRMITLILPLCCLFNPERHELARGIYIYYKRGIYSNVCDQNNSVNNSV